MKNACVRFLSLPLYLTFQPETDPNYAVSEERCNEVESLVFDLFASLGATGADFFDAPFYPCLIISSCDYHWICLCSILKILNFLFRGAA